MTNRNALVSNQNRFSALGLTGQQAEIVVQLAEVKGGQPVEDTLALIEAGGVSVPRIAECALMRADTLAFSKCEIGPMARVIDMIGFSSSKGSDEVEIDPSKVIVGGRALSIEEYEKLMLAKLTGGKSDVQIPEGTTLSFTLPHVHVMEELIEAVEPLCGSEDPAVFLTRAIEQHFQGEALTAYLFIREKSPEDFQSVILVGMDPEDRARLFEKDEEDGDDILIRLKGLGITPESLGIFGMAGSASDPDEDGEYDWPDENHETDEESEED